MCGESRTHGVERGKRRKAALTRRSGLTYRYSACPMISTSCWLPCAHGIFLCPSSSRTSPSSRRCTRNNGNPSWATAMNFSTWAATNRPPTSSSRKAIWAKAPSGWTPTARVPAIRAATLPTTRSRAGS